MATFFASGLALVITVLFAVVSFLGSDPNHVKNISSAAIFVGSLIFLNIIGQVIYQYYYYKLYDYEFTDEGGMIQKGVISRATGHVRYQRIQNIYIDQDVLDRLFGLYDVHYETAGEHSAFYSHVDGLRKEHANLLSDFLSERTSGLTSKKDIESTTKLASEDAVTDSNSTVEVSSKANPLQPSVRWEKTIKTTLWTGLLLLVVSSSWAEENIIGWLIFLVITIPVLGSCWRVYYGVWYRNFRYSLGSTRGEVYSRVIGSSATLLYYDRIQDVSVSQGILERVFNLYSVFVQSAGSKYSGLAITGLSKESANLIKDFLLERAKLYKPGL